MRILLLVFLSLFSTLLSAQMEVDGEILYGNEWIDYDKTYLKVKVNRDGIYRIYRNDLLENGIPLDQISIQNLELYCFGQSIDFYADPNEEFIEFYGRRNRMELDKFLFSSDDDIINPDYSLISDETAYFITWGNSINPNLISTIETNLSGNILPPEAYYNHRELQTENEYFFKPTVNPEKVRYSNCIASEGYGSGAAVVHSTEVSISGWVDNGSESLVTIRFGGNGGTLHRTEIRVNGNIKDTIDHFGNIVIKETYELAPEDLDQESVDIQLKTIAINGQGSHVLGLVVVNYPREFRMDNDTSFMFHVEPSNTEKYIEIAGYDFEDVPIIYDSEDGIRILPERIGNDKVGFLLPPHMETKQFFLTSSEFGIRETLSIQTREFINYDNPDYDYLIITNEELRNQSSVDWVEAYADYRSSEIGGSFVPLIANVDQLYDQYAYGTDRHFIALRNFGFWSKENYSNPKYMFIIGKGREYAFIRTKEQILENVDAYVPTFGLPGSDNLILSSDNNPIPIFPIGRIAAKSAQEVKEYLDKVMEHEQNKHLPQTIEDRQWQKKVLHLSGGDPESQDIIAFNLKVMEDTLSQNMFGADVSTFYKKSIEAIEVATTDRIFELINNGLSIITFFGHSSVGKFDFSIDNIDKYENKGKYPFILSLGCYSGNIHTEIEGISEQFVVRKDRGAIAFAAASGTAYIGPQYLFALRLYQRMGGEDYGISLGNNLLNVMKEYEGNTGFVDVTFLQQLTIHGDPAIRLASFETVDLTPDPSSVKTTPTFVDTYEENFEICFDVVNIGKYIQGEYDILLEHFDPNGDLVTDTLLRYEVPRFADRYCIRMPIPNNNLVGKNTIKIDLDVSDEIDERPAPDAEFNNKLISKGGTEGFEFYILNNSAIPIFPEEFSIVNTADPSLVASTYNAFGDGQKFIMQIDTTRNFDSPLMQETQIDNVRGIAQWDLDISMQEKEVYYWRISPDSTSTGVGYVWSTSSFAYDPGERAGWNQSHYYQFLQNDFENLELMEDREFYFSTNLKEIIIKNKVWESELPAEFIIDNGFKSSMMERNTSPSIGVAVLDTLGRFVMNPLGGAYGSINLDSKPIRTFYFKTDNQQSRIDLINFLENEEVIPDGYYVCVYNIFKNNDADFKVPEWQADSLVNDGKNIFNYLESQGAMNIRRMQVAGEALPFGFIYQNNVSPLAEGVAEQRSDEVEVKELLPGFWFEGGFKSDLIGPAQSWDELDWSLDNSSVMPSDTAYMKIYGYDINKSNEELLFDRIVDKTFDLQSIDASQYPFLKVEFYANDLKEVSPAQLTRIRIYYEGFADLAIHSTAKFNFHADSLQQGDDLKLEYEVVNFSENTMEETEVEYRLIDQNNNLISEKQQLPELNGKESETVNFSYNTRNLRGEYQLQIQMNPERNPAEKHYFNNFGFKEFEVMSDNINPLLDVRFDGVVIMDQDIVSSNPLITIELLDENPFILLENPENFVVLLRYPDGNIEQISLDDPVLTFYPAVEGEKNAARIEYNPELVKDGEYQLTVEARDESNNSSGDQNYEVRFRVFNKEMVSNVFNYPNPFSTSTQFIFTLTGNEKPGNILIRIMTLSGKVVREITAAELGSLRIGINRTDYKWDGRDEFGDKLANGTYLYLVITKKIDGSDYEHFSDPTQNNTDYLFKESFGKLVIIR